MDLPMELSSLLRCRRPRHASCNLHLRLQHLAPDDVLLEQLPYYYDGSCVLVLS